MYKLSDLFEKQDGKPESEPELELKVTVLNINCGNNGELLEKCESLRGYMAFVEKVREKSAAGVPLETAVPEAVDGCIAEGILADFFRENRKEIVEMGIFEFDQELHDQALRDGGYEEGEADGIKKGEEIGIKKGEEIGIKKGRVEGIEIYRQIQSGNTDNKAIAKACGCSLEAVDEIRKQFGI